VNVKGRLLPNHIVVTSEVLKEVFVSYNILSVSVPKDAIQNFCVVPCPVPSLSRVERPASQGLG